jgi:hypothetical protein
MYGCHVTIEVSLGILLLPSNWCIHGQSHMPKTETRNQTEGITQVLHGQSPSSDRWLI